jgi:outer membrane protein TolC
MRSNYLFGLGVTWNITSWARIQEQARSQLFNSRALLDEYNLVSLQIKSQLSLAESKITNAIANYNEAPLQVKAAQDAYLQKYTLYRNGLTSIIDVTQTLYTLNRAETNRDVAYSNIWQSLLLKAAATGDLDLFMNQVR